MFRLLRRYRCVLAEFDAHVFHSYSDFFVLLILRYSSRSPPYCMLFGIGLDCAACMTSRIDTEFPNGGSTVRSRDRPSLRDNVCCFVCILTIMETPIFWFHSHLLVQPVSQMKQIWKRLPRNKAMWIASTPPKGPLSSLL